MLRENPFTHLRPTTIPETLDRTLAVLFRFAPLMFLASFIAAGDYLGSIVINHIQGVDTTHRGIVIGQLTLMLLGDFAAAVSMLAMFQGLLFPLRPLSLKALMRTALRKLPIYFFTQFIYLLGVVFCAIIAFGFFTSRVSGPYQALWPALGVLATLTGIWIAVRLSLAPVVSLIEETWPLAAFSRSRHLTATLPAIAGNRRDSPVTRWTALMLLPALICIILAAIALITTLLTPKVTLPLRWNNPTLIDIRNVLAFSATFLALPFFRAALMSLYVEYRMRHEALDFYLRLRERRREETKTPRLP